MGTAPTPARFTKEQENLWKIYTNTLETLNLHLDRCLKEEVKIKLADYRILAAILDEGGFKKPFCLPESVGRGQ